VLVTPVFAVVNFASGVFFESGFSSVFFDVGFAATGFSVLGFSAAGLVETGFAGAAFSAVGFTLDTFFAGSAGAFEADFFSEAGFAVGIGFGFVAGADLDSASLVVGFAGAAFVKSAFVESGLVLSGFPAGVFVLDGLLEAATASVLSALAVVDFPTGVLDDESFVAGALSAGNFADPGFGARAFGSVAFDSGAEGFAAGVFAAGVLDAGAAVEDAVFVVATRADPLDLSAALGGSTGFVAAVPVALADFLSGLAGFPTGAAGGADFDALPAPEATVLVGVAAATGVVGFLAGLEAGFGRSKRVLASLLTARSTSQTTLSLELAWKAIPAWCSNDENSRARFFGIVRSKPGTLPDEASESLTIPDNIMIFIEELSTGIAWPPSPC